MKKQVAVADSVEGAVCGLIPARSLPNATRLALGGTSNFEMGLALAVPLIATSFLLLR